MRLIDADALLDDYLRRVARYDIGEFEAANCFPYWIMHAAITEAPTVCVASMLSLNGLRDAAYTDALYHGLWREDDTLLGGAQMIRAEAMELIQEAAHGEVTEALAEELADVIIGALSFGGRFGIDVDKAVRRKMAINKGRAFRHGKE